MNQQPDGLAPEPARPAVAIPRAGLAALADDPYAQQTRGGAPNPLMMLPADWRQPVAVLWTTNAHMLPSSLALCSRLRLYAEETGLTTGEVKTICRVLTEPGRAAQHKFASDLLADLSQMVATCNARRKAQADNAERRADAARFERRGLSGPGDLFPAVDFSEFE